MPQAHASITDPDIHEPTGVASATDGQLYHANGAGSGDWKFPEFVLQTKLDDISTASTAYAICPFAGNVTKITTMIDGAIATADATLTSAANGLTMVNGTITVAFSGSAVGDVDTASPTGNNSVAAGQRIETTTSGASTNTVACYITYTIQRTG